MSAMRDAFDAAARRSEWDAAYQNLNGLNMTEMLLALDSLPEAILRALHQQAHRYFGRYGVLRIEWAFRVVVAQEISRPVPGDLEQTGQVKDAEEFLRAKVASVKLSFTQKGFSESGFRGCGGFSRAIIWKLEGAGKLNNGHIVQKVQNIFRVNRCDGSALNISTQTYWEAWQVIEGKITGSSFTVSGGDLWTMNSSPGARGSWEKKGWAKYLEGYQQPKQWGTQAFAQAGTAIASTLTEPAAPWSEAGAIHRWYRMNFDCCDGKDESALTSWNGDARLQVE